MMHYRVDNLDEYFSSPCQQLITRYEYRLRFLKLSNQKVAAGIVTFRATYICRKLHKIFAVVVK